MADTEKFWAAIAANRGQIDAAVKKGLGSIERDAVLAVLVDVFDKSAPGIDFEFGVDREGTFELIISAGGIRAKVAEVQSIVAAAPKFDNWRIIAFKPRQDLSLQLHVGAHVCEISRSRVSWKELGGKFHVVVFLDVPIGTPKDVLTQVGFLVLDVALGEFDVMTHLGAIEGKPLKTASTVLSLPAIGEFVAAFDKRFAGRPQ